MRATLVGLLSVAAGLILAGSTILPLMNESLRPATVLGADIEEGRSSAPSVQPGAVGSEEATPPVLQTFGSHQYWTSRISNILPEVAMTATPQGTVYTLDDNRIWKSANGGQTWTAVALLPPNIGLVTVPEGDIAVAPNGDLISNWMNLDLYGHSTKVWVSKDNGATWSFSPAVGPQPFPDRPWIVISSTSPPAANGLGPNPYLSINEAGGFHWVSWDRGTTWTVPPVQLIPLLTPVGALPIGPDPWLDYAKPYAQGNEGGGQYLALANGVMFDYSSKQWTVDGIHWTQIPNPTSFPTRAAFPWWDATSDGKIFATQFVQEGGVWKIKYKFYDGAVWRNGNLSVPLAAKPNYKAALDEHDTELMAIKARGSGFLAINTREGMQDVLIRIQNPTSATPSFTKESIGTGSTGRYDFPNVVIDNQGRVVTTYMERFVAYATTT